MKSKEKVHQMTRDVFKAVKWLWVHSKFKKQNVETVEPVETGKEPEENLLSKCIVPIREFSTKPLHAIDESYNSFDVIVDVGEPKVKYRLKSDSSKEVFRMHCVCKMYRICYVDGFSLTKEVKKKLNEALDSWQRCLSEYDEDFWIRVYRTNEGNYFKQCIMSDGRSAYGALTRKRVQEFVEKCEDDDVDEKKWIWKRDVTNCKCRVLRDGTEIEADTELSDIHIDRVIDHEEITGFSVVDKELYDGIIEVY